MIKDLINEKGWNNLPEKINIKEIYDYEVKFGYNIADYIAASEILKDGYGQCNTKGILFIALLRAVEIPRKM